MSSVECKSSALLLAEHGSRYLLGHAHNGCVKFRRTYTALHTCNIAS